MTPARLDEIRTGLRMRKATGDYSVTGVVAAVFRKRSGALRVVLECDIPDGLLLIFNLEQLEVIREV